MSTLGRRKPLRRNIVVAPAKPQGLIACPDALGLASRRPGVCSTRFLLPRWQPWPCRGDRHSSAVWRGADLGCTAAAVSFGQALGSAVGGLLFDVSVLTNAVFAVATMVFVGLPASLGLHGSLHVVVHVTVWRGDDVLRRPAGPKG